MSSVKSQSLSPDDIKWAGRDSGFPYYEMGEAAQKVFWKNLAESSNIRGFFIGKPNRRLREEMIPGTNQWPKEEIAYVPSRMALVLNQNGTYCVHKAWSYGPLNISHVFYIENIDLTEDEWKNLIAGLVLEAL